MYKKRKSYIFNILNFLTGFLSINTNATRKETQIKNNSYIKSTSVYLKNIRKMRDFCHMHHNHMSITQPKLKQIENPLKWKSLDVNNSAKTQNKLKTQ